ncbi:copper amine oxidase N-terminal domain-containing protein [Paenibacillus polymyxa]|uniref:copper amine oxidase N-terminal domain-containing protein n=1 Tax=Paenibacillus polymyxa TaxID=1406 RepID=UPI00065750BD|nr:copper amine oxidase N-terminal domain-containing protein [Paenibacillus polymyxa]WPQ56731.1 copper amine oxidase N-terminal domain-containing protein [Paenibacillus polymyxa]
MAAVFCCQACGTAYLQDYREKQEITIFSEHGEIVRLTVGSKVAYVNDKEKIMPSAPVMPESPNRVMVPLRWVSEIMGATVNSALINETIHVNIIKPHLSNIDLF